MSSTFGNSALVRLLSQWAPVREPAAGTDLAEGLGRWVTAFDAIGLQVAHREIRAMGAAGGARGVLPRAALADDFARTRAALAQAVAQAPVLPNESTYAPFKRRHLELQRQMAQAVGALRERVRQALLAHGAPPLRQLAALDAVLDRSIAPREQAILPTAVSLLEQRFKQLRAAHLHDARASGGDDDPLAWHQPGGWLHRFEAEWRQAVLAELALRLEPVAGLLEAGGIEPNEHP